MSKQNSQKQKKSKHVPMRMCAVTRERLPKGELVRFVKTEDGLHLDWAGKLRGRGVNLKPDLDVLDQAFKRKVFERNLKVSLDDPQRKSLREEFEKYLEDKGSGEKKVVRISSDQLSKLVKGKSGKEKGK